MGKINLSRAYYYCPTCKSGMAPQDATLGVVGTHFTPAASELISLAGLKESFSQASETSLRKMSGLQVSESTVERTTEAAGERLRNMLEEKKVLGSEESWEWSHDAHGHTIAYISIDATSVPQQGARGAKSAGRMAYVGMFYNARGASETKQRKAASIARNVRYSAGYFTLEELGARMRMNGEQIGFDKAEQQIALSDGGNGLEDFFRKNFPRAEVIIDFWHVKEYLVELAQSLFGEGSAERKTWCDEQCHRLKHEGGAAVLQTLQQLDLSDRSATVQEKLRVTIGYFENHQHKMNYPRYVANGWQIGSGQVESGCKRIINARLAGTGMRWGEFGSDGVCHLRALHYSDASQWDNFWYASSC